MVILPRNETRLQKSFLECISMSIETTIEKLDEVSKDLRGSTMVTEDELFEFFEEFDVLLEVSLALPSKDYTASDISKGYCCAFEIKIRECGLRFPINPLLLEYLQALKFLSCKCVQIF